MRSTKRMNDRLILGRAARANGEVAYDAYFLENDSFKTEILQEFSKYARRKDPFILITSSLSAVPYLLDRILRLDVHFRSNASLHMKPLQKQLCEVGIAART